MDRLRDDLIRESREHRANESFTNVRASKGGYLPSRRQSGEFAVLNLTTLPAAYECLYTGMIVVNLNKAKVLF